MAEEIGAGDERDRKISLPSLSDDAEAVELTAPQGSLSDGIMDMVRQYLKPELDAIKARLDALESATEIGK